MIPWLPFKDKKLVLLLFVHDQVLTCNYAQPFFIWGLLDSNNLIWLSTIGIEKGNWDGLDFPEVLAAVDIELTDIGDKNAIHRFDLDRFGPFHVERIDTDSEVVKIFPLEDLE